MRKADYQSSVSSWPIIGIDDNQMPIIEAYEAQWPMMSDIALELACYRMDRKKEDGGLGAARHMLNAYMLIWPHYNKSIHEWLLRRIEVFCERHTVMALAGGGGCAKSRDMAYIALLHWWSLPLENTVLVASTTLSMLKSRIWSYFKEGIDEAKIEMPGKISHSPSPKVVFSPGETKHGIFGTALKEGISDRTLSDLIGIHPKNSLVVCVDEATDVTPAIKEAITNWKRGGHDFQMVVIGNSKNRLDTHGKFCKPKKGWGSIDPDIHTEWVTDLGKCLYFDCYKSPAIKHPENKILSNFLITTEEIKEEQKRLGENSPSFWRFVRGFWPAEDDTKTVITQSLLETHNAFKKAEFSGEWVEHVAALDPAFTSEGDEAILRFAKVGPMTNGLIGIDLGGPENIVSVKLNEESNEPINYQLVKETKKICESRGIKSKHFGVDTWGFGSGAGDIFEKMWSSDVHRVVSVGAPTDSFINSDMTSTAKEQFDRRVTELWFMVKEFVESEQIRGLDIETAEELSSRSYEWKGRKISIERKEDYKKRMGKEDGPTGSPDRADALAILIDVIRFKLGVAPSSKRATEVDDKRDWEKQWEYQIKNIENEKQDDKWQEDGILYSDMFMEY